MPGNPLPKTGITEVVVTVEITNLKRKALALAAAKGWSVMQFALEMGMTRQRLHRALDAPTMRRDMFARLNRVLGVSPGDWTKRRMVPTLGEVARDLMRGFEHRAGKVARAEKRLDGDAGQSES